MSLLTLHEDLNKYESDGRVIRKNIKDLLPLKELFSLFKDLEKYEVNNISVNLDDKTTLNIIYKGSIKLSIIEPEGTYTIIFYNKYQPVQDSLELSYFYTALEPYKEIIEDKIEEGFRKEIELDKLVKKEN